MGPAPSAAQLRVSRRNGVRRAGLRTLGAGPGTQGNAHAFIVLDPHPIYATNIRSAVAALVLVSAPLQRSTQWVCGRDPSSTRTFALCVIDTGARGSNARGSAPTTIDTTHIQPRNTTPCSRVINTHSHDRDITQSRRMAPHTCTALSYSITSSSWFVRHPTQ